MARVKRESVGCLVHVRHFSSPSRSSHFGDVFKAMGGKCLDKKRIYMPALLFEIQDVVKVVNSRKLLEICRINFCPPALKVMRMLFIYRAQNNGRSTDHVRPDCGLRSEERRVGKE